MAPHALWTSAEEMAFVVFLHENKSEAGDGGNFKKPTLQRASQHIAPLCTNGHVKDFKSCQNKWAAVSTSVISSKLGANHDAYSSARSSRLSLRSSPFLVGIGTMRLVLLSPPKQHLPGTTMSKNTLKPNHSEIKAGPTSAKSRRSCLPLLLVPTSFTPPLLHRHHLWLLLPVHPLNLTPLMSRRLAVLFSFPIYTDASFVDQSHDSKASEACTRAFYSSSWKTCPQVCRRRGVVGHVCISRQLWLQGRRSSCTSLYWNGTNTTPSNELYCICSTN